jgi:diguanylate cyclase (GGDEF)-like protein
MIKSFLLRVATPGGFPPGLVETISFLALVALFVLEMAFGSEIWLRVLYIFPLVAIAIHCELAGIVVLGFFLAVACQCIAILSISASPAARIINTLVAFAWPTLVVLLSRFARASYFAMANLANQDSLTGLPNRRHFESVAKMEIARQRRYGGVFSLAIADLDNFKGLNDSRGHFVGDQALRLVAKLLQESTRQSDLVARLGGDEFGILMPNTEEVDCDSLCRKLCVKIAYGMSEAGYATSASIGSASFEKAPDSISAAMQSADKAMYAVKAELKRPATSGLVPAATA